MVGQKGAVGGAVTLEVALDGLDVVLILAPGAVEVLVERLGGRLAQGGDDEAGIVAEGRDFGFEDDPTPVSGAPEEVAVAKTAARPLPPDWLIPAPREERTPRLSPSSLVAHDTDGGAGLGRELALVRGSAVHLLLEKLPNCAASDRPVLARRLLANGFHELADDIAEAALAEALAVLEAPFAASVFGPESLADACVPHDQQTKYHARYV